MVPNEHRAERQETAPCHAASSKCGQFSRLESLFRAPSIGQGYLLLTVLCLVLFLPGFFSIPPIDRDEARFAQATRQMLETGDYVRINFQEQPRHKKPVGIYWLQALSAKLSAQHDSSVIWPFRLPSLMGAILAVLGTFAIGRRLFNDQQALLGAALLAGTLLLGAEARLATTDAMLLACLVFSQLATAGFYRGGGHSPRPQWGLFALFWTAQGIGILIKGPIVPFITVLTIASLGLWDRKWGWLRGLRIPLGLLLLFLIVLPWTVAIWSATDGGFFQDALSEDFLPKLFSGQESHGSPPGTYLLLLSLFFWPAVSLLGLTCADAWQERISAAVRFCICWIVPAWLVFEAIPTKLPHYVLPLYPALALLTAHSILKTRPEPLRWPRFWPRPVALIFMGLYGIFALAVGAFLPWFLQGRPDPIGLLAALLGVATSAQASRLLLRNQLLRAQLFALAGSAIVLGMLFQVILPRLDAMWLSRTVRKEVLRLAAAGELPAGDHHPGNGIAAAGYHEPSLVFLLGTHTRLLSTEGAAQFLAEEPAGLTIIWDRDLADFQQAAEARGLQLRELGAVEGFNYSKGKFMRLVLFRNRTDSSPDGKIQP